MASSSKRFFSLSDISDSVESMETIHGKDRPIIFWLFLLVVGASICSIFLVKVDVTVAGVGQIRPEIERLQVISTVSGYIKELNVLDNQSVKEGQVLLSFESEALEAKIEYCQDELLKNEGTVEDLSVLESGLSYLSKALESTEPGEIELHSVTQDLSENLLTPRIRKEYANFVGQIERLKIEYDKANHDFQRIAKLREKDFISVQDYEDKQHQMETALRLLKIAVLQKANEWQAEKEERSLRISGLESESKQLEEQTHLYVIKAPTDGTAIGFRGLQKGLLIPQGQTIGEISPASRLLAEVYVSPQDVGFLSEGQETKVLVDAFPHTEWGTLSGKVKEISRDFIQIGDSIAFRTVVELDKLHLQSRKGVEVEVTRGMTINSRFLIRKRTIFNILFSKMSDAFDPRGNE